MDIEDNTEKKRLAIPRRDDPAESAMSMTIGAAEAQKFVIAMLVALLEDCGHIAPGEMCRLIDAEIIRENTAAPATGQPALEHTVFVDTLRQLSAALSPEAPPTMAMRRLRLVSPVKPDADE